MPLKILLADDSLNAQNMGKKILAEAGHEVVVVSNGAAAAKKLGDKFDIFILDVYMPGYTGIELCEKIRAGTDTAKTPVLLTVGKVEPYNPQDGQRVRADGVIIKPFEANDLLATVQKIEKKITAAAAPPLPLTKNATGQYERTMIFTPPQIEEFKDDSYHEWKSEADDITDAEHKPAPPLPLPVATASQDAAPSMASFEDTIRIEPPKGVQAAPPAAPPPMAGFEDTIRIEPPKGAPASPQPAPIVAFSDTLMVPPPAPVASAPPALSVEDTVTLQRTPEQMNEFLDTVQMPVPNPESIASAPTTVMSAPVMSAPAMDMSMDLTPPSPPAMSMDLTPSAPTMSMDMTPSAPAMSMDFGPSAPAMDLTPPPALTANETDRMSALLEPTAAAPVAGPITPAPEVEFTAAPKAGNVEVKAEAGLEVDGGGHDIVIAKDPSLVTDATEMAKEFVTKFGVEGDHDDFEGRVTIPGVTPAPPAAVAPAAESAPAPAVAPLVDGPPPDQGMTADLMEQMNEAVSSMEVDETPHAEHHDMVAEIAPPIAAPIEVAAPGGTAEVSITTGGVDHELASQLAAALGAPPPSASEVQEGAVTPGTLLSGLPIEEQTISGVVARVMERMRPTIILEVQKELETARKKTVIS